MTTTDLIAIGVLGTMAFLGAFGAFRWLTRVIWGSFTGLFIGVLILMVLVAATASERFCEVVPLDPSSGIIVPRIAEFSEGAMKSMGIHTGEQSAQRTSPEDPPS